ncbi:MAG: hypothetical protein GY743_23535 [Planctomycetaceae bacterium]|nr:hypothetical protein [Planctomycetaceae bacterium]
MKKWLVGAIIAEAGIGFGLLQTPQPAIPDTIISFLLQLPPLVGVIIWLQFRNQKWLEHMLSIQRASLKEVYKSQEVFMVQLLEQMADKQDEMARQVGAATDQAKLTQSVVREILVELARVVNVEE